MRIPILTNQFLIRYCFRTVLSVMLFSVAVPSMARWQTTLVYPLFVSGNSSFTGNRIWNRGTKPSAGLLPYTKLMERSLQLKE